MLINRKTLFLYPNLSEFDNDKQEIISQLITDLKIIINKSNNSMEKILRSGSFAYIRCLPTIDMEEINAINLNDSIAELVRICVLGYNGNCFENEYSDICTKYIQNEIKISHLVGLKINSKSDDVRFIQQENSPYDVIIETGLNNLESIIVSIMLDISLYHYFYLSDNITYRKNFSKTKIKRIKSLGNTNDYGKIENFDKISYLPISYPCVKDTLSTKEQTAQKQLIEKLIIDYFDFIINFVCDKIIYNKIKEPVSYDETSINDETLNTLDKIINSDSFNCGKKYLVLVSDYFDHGNITSNNEKLIVIENKEGAIEKWLLSVKKSLSDYSLYYIEIGD